MSPEVISGLSSIISGAVVGVVVAVRNGRDAERGAHRGAERGALGALNGSADAIRRIESGQSRFEEKFDHHVMDDAQQFGEISRSLGRLEGRRPKPRRKAVARS